METLKVLTCLTVMALASATAAAAQSSGPYDLNHTPNCTQADRNCLPGANQPTSDISANNPIKNSPYDPNKSPNCTQADRNCIDSQPTSNVTKVNPAAQK